ncbi:FtsX-like permease family protein [Diaminobutyricimonas sp. LJ205]|uniref:FtsX-like permease family protein n=1 Tax=Diaminobutyricimonas sp. LJ205 TaxID=2683590 RepID=UPI0012F4A7E6|nr:FtsX-like permease family protein [Diaminobutyricimonas sp. LJ205]
MAVVPRAVRRVLRDRPRTVAVALLALVSIAAAGVNGTAAERLQALLDENWRGAYDILVTKSDVSEMFDGVLTPTALVSSDIRGLPLSAIDEVRGIDGVEVAAPIGSVSYPMSTSDRVRFVIPLDMARTEPDRQAYRATMTFVTDDGLGERIVARNQLNLWVDATNSPSSIVLDPSPEMENWTCEFQDASGKVASVSANESYLCRTRHFEKSFVSLSDGSGIGNSRVDEIEGSVVITLPGTPVLASRITLIDPEAERALLGAAGDFLSPLVDVRGETGASLGPLRTWMKANALPSYSEAADAYTNGMRDSELDEALKAEYERLGLEINAPDADSFDALATVPVLVAEQKMVPLKLTLALEGFGPVAFDPHGPPGIVPLPDALLAGQPGVPVGEVTADPSPLLTPFTSQSVYVPWAGSGLVIDSAPIPTMSHLPGMAGAAAPQITLREAGEDGKRVAELTAAGFISPAPVDMSSGTFGKVVSDGTATGLESVYFTPATPAQQSGYPAGVPIGSFNPEEIVPPQTELGHVPLGAYEIPASTLVADPDGKPVDPVELAPSLSGFGLVNANTSAIADITRAPEFGSTLPVSAIRVRVGGIEAYTPDTVARVAAVAQQIEELGYVATVVAGSSPQDVSVLVRDWAFGTLDPNGTQTVGDLGYVNQSWSSLGAAAQVDLTVSGTSLSVLAVALAASALLLAAVQFASVPGRRAQAAVLRTIGWRRRRIVRWMAAEETVSLTVVALAGTAALALASSRSIVGGIVAVSLAALIATSALAVTLGARPPRTTTASGGRTRHSAARVTAWVTSSLRFAARQLVVHRTNAIVQFIATAVVAVAASAVTVTVIEGQAAVGPTILGAVAADQALIAQLALGAIALIAGVVLAVIARRIDLDRRSEQWRLMRAMGWSAGGVRGVQMIEGLMIGVPSVAAAGGLSWLYLNWATPELAEQTIPVALSAAGLLVVTVVLTGWRETRWKQNR